MSAVDAINKWCENPDNRRMIDIFERHPDPWQEGEVEDYDGEGVYCGYVGIVDAEGRKVPLEDILFLLNSK